MDKSFVKIYRKDGQKFNIKISGQNYDIFSRYCLENKIERNFTIISRSNQNFNKSDFCIEKVNGLPDDLYEMLNSYFNCWQQRILQNPNDYPPESFDIATQIKKSIL